MVDLSGSTILIVDDVDANIDVLSGVLGGSFDINIALNGERALKSVAEELPDLVLLDIMMPGMDGYEVCRRLKGDPLTSHIPIIFVTALGEERDEAKGLALGAVDYITKPFSPELVRARVHNHLLLKIHQDELEELVRERTRQLELTQDITIKSLATLVECRDPDTGGHIKRTQNFVKLLADHLHHHGMFKDVLTSESISLLYKSAPLHDIGKVAVADHILLKPGELTEEEDAELRKHPQVGHDTLAVAEREVGEEITFLHYAKEIALTHHEKWDGSGYPHGLVGAEIPVSGRLMAIADVYDALISKRVYKPPFPHGKAVTIIRAGRGRHFDPDMVDAFLQLERQFRQIAFEFADFAEEKAILSET